MPKKHPKEKKLEALELLSYGQSVSTVQFATGIPVRTIYNWQKRLKQQTDRQSAKKSSTSATNAPQNTDSGSKSADSRQSTLDSCHNDALNHPDLPQTRHSVSAQPDTTDDPDNTDIEDFTFIREQLMKYARQMASDLRPDEPDSNRRTLALTRILDRIQWLDEILPDRIPEQTVRFEFFYDGKVQEHPPWHGASEGKPRMTVEDLLPTPSVHESPPDDPLT